MLRRSIHWPIALVIVIVGGILPTVLILRTPGDSTTSPGIASAPGGGVPAAPPAESIATRPRLLGISRPDESERQAPLHFGSAQSRPTLPIPATIDDPREGARTTSNEALAGPLSGPSLGPAVGPALGAPRVTASGARILPPAAPPATLEIPQVGAVPQAIPVVPRQGAPLEQQAPSPFETSWQPVPTAPVEETISPPIERTTAMRRAAQHNQDGFALVAKGAWYSARSEFHAALELAVAAADALEGSSARSRLLREAQTALREAGDFAPRNATRSTRIDVAHLVSGHQSKVIDPESAAAWAAAAAHEAYLAYAKRRLADAGSGQRIASVALHGLGKVHAALGSDDRDRAIDNRKKARTLFEAGLEIGPDNFIAANDLAVLLAEEGDWERGRAALEAGLRVSRQPAMLQNLATIYRRMGQPQAADQLRGEAAALERLATAGVGDLLPSHDVRWLDPRQFASTARGGADAGRTPPPYEQPAANPGFVTPAAVAQPVAAEAAAGTGRGASTAARPVRNALVY